MAVVKNINIHPITAEQKDPPEQTAEKFMLISLVLLFLRSSVLCHLLFFCVFIEIFQQLCGPEHW